MTISAAARQEQRGLLSCEARSPAKPTGTGPSVCGAASLKDGDALSLLLEGGADPNVISDGVAPLHVAVFSGDLRVVEVLLAHRADPNLRDRAGQTPLFFAPSRPICEALARAAADIGVTNTQHQSALHLAAHAGMNEALEWLVTNSPPDLLNMADACECTPADYAVWSRSKATVRLLRLHRARPSRLIRSAPPQRPPLRGKRAARPLVQPPLSSGDQQSKDAMPLSMQVGQPKEHPEHGTGPRLAVEAEPAAGAAALDSDVTPAAGSCEGVSVAFLPEAERGACGQTARAVATSGSGHVQSASGEASGEPQSTAASTRSRRVSFGDVQTVPEATAGQRSLLTTSPADSCAASAAALPMTLDDATQLQQPSPMLAPERLQALDMEAKQIAAQLASMGSVAQKVSSLLESMQQEARLLTSPGGSADDGQGTGLQNAAPLPGSVSAFRSVDAGVQAMPDTPASSSVAAGISPKEPHNCKAETVEARKDGEAKGAAGKKRTRKAVPPDSCQGKQPQALEVNSLEASDQQPGGALREPISHQLSTWEVTLEGVAAPDEQFVTALRALNGAPLVIRKISESGSLARWSAEHPEAAVQTGDYIVQVDSGKSATSLRLRVARPMETFEVCLDKEGGALGIDFQRHGSELRIVEVLPGGALARHNSRRAAGGGWELVVLPEMRIVAVNDVQDDAAAMVKLLRDCPSVLLRIRRANADLRSPALC